MKSLMTLAAMAERNRSPSRRRKVEVVRCASAAARRKTEGNGSNRRRRRRESHLLVKLRQRVAIPLLCLAAQTPCFFDFKRHSRACALPRGRHVALPLQEW